MNISALFGRSWLRGLAIVTAAIAASGAPEVQAGEQKIVLRDYIKQQWKNELLTYDFKAEKGQCHPESVELRLGARRVPVQLSDVATWPGTPHVKSAKLSFIASLAPLAKDTYTVRYAPRPTRARRPTTDLKVGQDKWLEFSTKQFGVQLLVGARTYTKPAAAKDVPGPVIKMRRGKDTWFGASRMFGKAKIRSYSAKLVATGPVFARSLFRYTYADGNTLDLTVQVAAGDNAMRMETRVKKHQPNDGFELVLSKGLPPLVFQIQDEARQDRPCFKKSANAGYNKAFWAEIPLKNYTAPKGQPAGLVTKLTPWEEWFTSFTQTRIRLKMQGTNRELQIRSLEPEVWVEPRPIEVVFGVKATRDPAKGPWVNLWQKQMPIMCSRAGEVSLQVNAAQGLRKWTISDCLSMKGVAALYSYHDYKPESTFPPETRPAVNYRLNEVKDYVLDWPDDGRPRPQLFVSLSELEALWKRKKADGSLLKPADVRAVTRISYVPDTSPGLNAYILSGGSLEVAKKTRLLEQLHQSLQYDLWSLQFGGHMGPSLLYDALINSPVVSETERPLLRAKMAYFVYRVTDPAAWSAEHGYASGNANMSVCWEITRGVAACAIPKHPMAKVWYRNAQRIMELFLGQMVGPGGEWPEAMGGHGRRSVDVILTFAIASTGSGMHDYVNDPRMKRLIMWWAKMQTSRDPRPRGGRLAVPNQRHFPPHGRDNTSVPRGTCGAMARATCKTDPDYSAVLQWAWLEEGGNNAMRDMGGFASVACDPKLPAKTPTWPSEVFPRAAAVLRHGLGSADEHQVILYSGDHCHAFYSGHTGGFASIFAYGTPVAGLFPGGSSYQEAFLTSHVSLARELGSMAQRQANPGCHGTRTRADMWSWPKEPAARFAQRGGRSNVSAFSTLPRQDYVAVDVARHYRRSYRGKWRTNLPPWPKVAKPGKPPVDTRRQVLALKDDDPDKVAYLLIRDTVKGVKGEQPTMWQMWTVSETVDTPAKVKNVAKVLANKPGHKILPARQLRGDRFTAIGQFDVDVEYYIASPADGKNTPRHTLRWGEVMWTWAEKLKAPEYQDLLHLQMPGDGAYFVAFFPRKRNMPAPTFSTLGDGTIIKVSGAFGVDYGFLSALDATASGEGANFRGTAASVQDRRTGLVLSLGAKGKVSYKQHGLAADFPAALRVGKTQLRIELPAGIQPPAFEMMKPFPGGTLEVSAPGKWTLAKPLPGVILTRSAEGFVLEVPAGLEAVTLVSGN